MAHLTDSGWRDSAGNALATPDEQKITLHWSSEPKFTQTREEMLAVLRERDDAILATFKTKWGAW